jgi:hydrogenase-4 component F
MTDSLLIVPLLVLPLIGIAVSSLLRDPKRMLQAGAVINGLQVAAAVQVLLACRGERVLFAFGKQLFVDTLSAYHLMLVAVIFFVTAVYAIGYFTQGEADHLESGRMRRYCLLWFTYLTTMVLVLLSNNLGLMWVALEATTLASAFLIMTTGQSASIEAMWKYLLVCSVGIAFALIGTLLLSAAANQTLAGSDGSLLWTDLRNVAGMFDRRLMLAAFIFALIGFGTKAGLAPMHTWLPDAHSQAPTPVSAVFSGVMLNSALYCILRYLPLTEAACGGSGTPHALMLVFGLMSIGVAMIFIPSQTDIKRLLAYCSVEHIGIITVGIGLGGLGTVAALFHTVNHSFSKVLAFFAVGRLSQEYGTRDMRSIRGMLTSNPSWGIIFFLAGFVLIGVAPFATFMSEFQILSAAVKSGRWVALAIFLVGVVVIFVSMLRQIFNVSFGHQVAENPRHRASWPDMLVASALLLTLLVLGVWIPHHFSTLLSNAAAIVEGRP